MGVGVSRYIYIVYIFPCVQEGAEDSRLNDYQGCHHMWLTQMYGNPQKSR